MGWLGETIGGIFGLAQSGIDAKTAKRNTDATNAANMRLAEYSYSKDLEMWNRQNEYNTPSAQMERFQQAGLNPNLIYGQGTAGNATTIPHYQAPRMEFNYKSPVNLLTVMSAFQDFNLKQAQTDSLRAVAEANQTVADIRKLEKLYKENTLTSLVVEQKAKGGITLSKERQEMIKSAFADVS